MPQPAEQERQQQVREDARFGRAIAAERHVQILAQKPRQRHVPSMPEVAQVE
jgi:hypothetical protein